MVEYLCDINGTMRVVKLSGRTATPEDKTVFDSVGGKQTEVVKEGIEEQFSEVFTLNESPSRYHWVKTRDLIKVKGERT